MVLLDVKRPRCLLEPLGAILEGLELFLCSLEGFLEPPGALFVASWRGLGPSWPPLGPSWGGFQVSWAPLGPS